eukprot:34207_1
MSIDSIDILQELLSVSYTDVDLAVSSNLRALALAAFRGNVDVVKLLISREDIVDRPNWIDANVMREAALNGKIEVVRLLLTLSDVDVSLMCAGGLIGAAKCGHIAIFKLLLEKEDTN